jgi:hypothetical protein
MPNNLSMQETKTTRSEALDSSRYHHLIPAANRLLVVTAKGGWRVMKGLVKIVLRLPTLFVKVNMQNANKRDDISQ